jgi:hypothetical protein
MGVRCLKIAVAAVTALLSSIASASAQCTGYQYNLQNNTTADASQVTANFNYILNCVKGLVTPPQGRLTLVQGTPVMTASQVSKTSIYYTAYVGNQLPIYNGSAMVPTPWSVDLSNITTNSATGNAGPAAVVANSNYDLFVWNNSGTITLTRGPVWTNDTTRSAGTNLQRISGIWTNQTAITNGPAANLGTYVGTVRSNGSSQIDFIFGGLATGGTAAWLGVWNAYNRVDIKGFVGDSTSSWSYNAPSWRPSDNSAAMRTSFIAGLQEDFAAFTAVGIATAGASQGNLLVGIGWDSTASPSGLIQVASSTGSGVAGTPSATYSAQALGFHFGQMLEYAQSSSTVTWFGTNGGSTPPMQSGLTYAWKY